uniref:NFX1-type zinc finger-containing protein 1-like n=1 Tax=Saccoglossus kowalevskii TaxID=10224 RepID=A0ABM0LXB6_SACKO|nr:PREDICTED: NFX1-type zinc finger-containing protein 1-like [Saccoglossus kowalevskii]
MPTETSGRLQEEFPKFIHNTIHFLHETLTRLPSSYDNLCTPLASLQVTVGILNSSCVMRSSDIDKSLNELVALRDDLMNKKRMGQKVKSPEDDESVQDEMHVNGPPNDFREVSIFPTPEDVLTKEQPYIRPNIVRGKYQDLDHYLDVQFRLYREDFLAPLREGIDEYISQLKDRNIRRHYQDIRVYTGVEIVQSVCTNQGLFHTLQFDISRLKRVNWEFSKRLIYGALVCLSNDDFKTMYFATVANRIPKRLQNGHIDVNFVGGTQTVSTLVQSSQRRQFTMVETSAYFEACNHVLKALQQIKEGELPFEQYFLHCDTDVQPPAYMRRRNFMFLGSQNDITFDFTPILNVPVLKTPLFDDSDSEDELLVTPLFESNETKRATKVPILKKSAWPSADILGFDESQLAAVHSALTKEISVIQGPPGTGKTYIGLKIAQLLLHNRPLWNKEEQQPLLVVCYTNHALDQFLEGIYNFQKKGIVRAGSRSSSEKMKKCTLSEIKHKNRTDRVVPRAIFTCGKTIKDNMKSLEEQISKSRDCLYKLSTSLIPLNILRKFISYKHQISLMRYSFGRGTRYSELHFWLGIFGNPFEQVMFDVGLYEEEEEEEEEEDTTKVKVDTEADMLQQLRIGDEAVEILTSDKPTRKPRAKKHNEKQSGEEWQTVNNKKKVKGRIRTHMRNKASMHVSEADGVHDVWQLQIEDRWRLYHHWLNRYTKQQGECIAQLERKYEKEAQRLQEIGLEEDLEILKDAAVIGMTTTGAARYRSILQRVKPKIIIVEEAAEVLEAHIITALTASCEQLILIGDHKQLRPTPNVYKLARKFNLDYSLFERMIKNNMHCDCLELQHRMRPEISVLMDHIYVGLKDHESVFEYENVKGVGSNVFFINHKYPEIENEELLSHANEHEAMYVAALCRYILLQGYDPSRVTVLTTYKGQLFKLKGIMKKMSIFGGVHVTAVDNFQGEENDIIILSLVRSNSQGKIGFLAVENRVCVALSRAKIGFYCVGNISFLADHSELWKKIQADMERRDCIGTSLLLRCQNHPGTTIEAKTEKDFHSAPEGGCMKPCEARLKCGHVCVLTCHPADPEHKIYKCRKPCVRKICDQKHPCLKPCFEECGNCMTKIPKIIPRCDHLQDVPCSVDPEDFVCLEKCKKTLECGHQCTNVCGVRCVLPKNCREYISRIWPCGHEVETMCRNKPEDYPCPEKCKEQLSCGDGCGGTCGTCSHGRLHIECKAHCGRTLVCGHSCKGDCTVYCPPCSLPCENRCSHGKCQGECGQPCNTCAERCQWRCQHYRCTKLCGEKCNRPRCDQPCKKILKCRHSCIGLCGEPCPKKCRICDRKEVTEIFFGDEDEPDALFIELEDCGHVFEVNGLDQWVDDNQDSSTEDDVIQLKVCPRCKTPIRKNLRYGNVIKSILSDIEVVKQKILGDKDSIELKVDELRYRLDNLTDRGVLGGNGDDANAKQQILDMLVAPDVLSSENLHAIENQINLLEAASGVEKLFAKGMKNIFITSLRRDSTTRQDVALVDSHIQRFIKWLMYWKYRMTDQALQDAETEISRLNLIANLYILEAGIRKHEMEVTQKRRNALDSLHKTIKNGEKMEKTKIDEWKKYLKMVQSSYPVLQPLSNELKAEIVKAVGLSAGHWYKCPNGHFYAIGECGGASERGTCPECGKAIGGMNHRLEDGNAHAPEMDGSRYAAYSDEANMNIHNFDIDDLF